MSDDSPAQRGWLPLAEQQRSALGAVVHAAAGRCTTQRGPALQALGPSAVAACLWAVGRGLPDEVVARLSTRPDGVDAQAEAVLSWQPGVDAEVLVATGVTERQWLVVTGTLGELEVRPAPYDAVAGELWLSDGAGTERLPFLRGEPARLVDEHDVDAVLTAIRKSAAQAGAPVAPS